MNIFEASHQLAYELLPTNSEQIKNLDQEMSDLYS